MIVILVVFVVLTVYGLTVYGLSRGEMTSRERAYYDSQRQRAEEFWKGAIPVGGGGTCVVPKKVCDCAKYIGDQNFSACIQQTSVEPIYIQPRIPVWSALDEWRRDCRNFEMDLDEFCAKWRGRVPRK